MIKRLNKLLIIIISTFLILSGLILCLYLWGIPALISNEKAISFAENKVKEVTNLTVNIDEPILKTRLNGRIKIAVKSLEIYKNNENIVDIKDFSTKFSIAQILAKKIKVREFGADNIFADVNELINAFPQEEKQEEPKPFDWHIDLFDSLLYINNARILYNITNDTLVDLKANNVNLDNTKKVERNLHLNFEADVIKADNKVHLAFKDEDKIVLKNKHIYVNGCPFSINKSKMFFNATASKKEGYSLEIFAKRFQLPDIIELLQTNIIENNINDILIMFDKINGNIDFDIKLTKNLLSGNVKVNDFSTKLLPLNNLPININAGNIVLRPNDLDIVGFKGFYANKKSNEFEFEGTVDDYLKTVDTNILMRSTISNDLIHDYIGKLAGINLQLLQNAKAGVLVKSKNNDIDVTMGGKIAKGNDILVEGASLSPVDYDRAFQAIVHVRGDKLNIEKINYYIAKEITRASKGIKPILTLAGDINIPDGRILKLGFDIPKPLPSEFLNVLIGQKLFKKGNFFGNMEYLNAREIPKIRGYLQADKILIPSQRMFLKQATISTNRELVNIAMNGKYKRSDIQFTGNIVNEMLFPIVFKDMRLTVDDLDVERVMQSFTAPVQTQEQAQNAFNEISDETQTAADDTQTFDFRNLVIEDCVVNIIKGKYKQINFSNIIANMSVDRNAILHLKSNKFDIAEGTSSTDVNCDLVNQKYSIKLGVKDVETGIMSEALLNLPKEITGKSSGIIDLNTDASLKLNGQMKFVIKNGTIQKVGLIEYILKFAALFRNPLAMISPSIFTDLVNVPEGNFDRITGELKLKDNRIELMKIKSSAPQLSAYIVGCYNLENSDAILRIYTKFSNKNKGVAGFLRNISLNSLANRIPLKSRNDINYYASELEQLPEIDADEKDCQIFITKVDGDVEHNNFISSLKKIK